MAGELKDGGARNADAGIGPPRLAETLITAATTASDRAALIGDLYEEFARLHRLSPQNAKNWYWRQTAKSAPHLLLKRMRAWPVQRLGIAVAATLGAFLLLSLWDLFIARNAARGFANLTQATNYTAPRMIYIGVQMLGVALAGGMIAILTFNRQAPFLKNVLTRLAPAAVVLFAPALFAAIVLSNDYSVGFRLLWTGLSLPSFAAGAAGAMWLISGRAP